MHIKQIQVAGCCQRLQSTHDHTCVIVRLCVLLLYGNEAATTRRLLHLFQSHATHANKRKADSENMFQRRSIRSRESPVMKPTFSGFALAS